MTHCLSKSAGKELLCTPFFQGEKQKFSCDFTAKEAEVALLYPQKGYKRHLLVGLGKKDEVTCEGLRRSYAAVSRVCQAHKIRQIDLELPQGIASKPILEGLLLASYAFDQHKQEKAVLLEKVGLLQGSEALFQEVLDIREGVFLARDLSSGNADEVTPSYLAELAKKFAKELKSVRATILDKKALTKEGLGLLLAVGRGAVHEPHLIILEYTGNPRSKEKSVLVGKGVTFDTGGLLLKPRGGMEEMRGDMSGAAVCFGTFLATVRLKKKVNLTVVVAAAENAIGSLAFKPGDVYCSYSGKSVEISDTDAEGRLVLADALAYAERHLAPTRMIDLATLTGAMCIALGEEIAGFFTDDEKLKTALEGASVASSEHIWQMPLYKDYRAQLLSDYADIRNKGERYGGAITAALFLQEFVKKTPWAHIDIAGPAFVTKEKHYKPKHGTGFGVRLLLELLS